ncbi:U-box domain-containing protein 32 isoform X2 [Impatiens glandulifera]|uniref:U-box domain-containing protein 32 isoform X2 n=1 Tax=Impatiens glandulifera TaxID=253017 RepID=UPI001FB11CAD|nr:U-box domain-containing protein 32 isoform X2 [Impatiens glandulifera]
MGGGEVKGLVDAENTIFVAVGNKEKDSKSVIDWSLRSFAGRRICLLHVHQPDDSINLKYGKLSVIKGKEQASEACQEFERKKMEKVFGPYLKILGQAGVQASSIWIQMDAVEKGIVESIAQHDIRWLVMGAAADNYYSKTMSEIKSKKANFVRHQAPLSCHIWFICNQNLIYTRAGFVNSSSYFERTAAISSTTCSTLPKLRKYKSEIVEDVDDVEGTSRDQISQLLDYSSTSKNKGDLVSDGETTSELGEKLEFTVLDVESSRQKAFEESVKRWKAEEDAQEATQMAEALETSLMNEKRQIKDLEEELAQQSQELKRIKNQLDLLKKELPVLQEENPILEDNLRECQSEEKVLTEKIIQAVNLMVIFKENRDKLQIERDKATGAIHSFRRLSLIEGSVFSFLEINEATHEFDPSWKVGDGKYGSVYKGLLDHRKVSIKMLPSSGSQSNLDFENEARFISSVRHPNLVTLIGTSSECRSLVYEYLDKGNLEDRLACQGKSPPLSWKIRMKIAREICMVLAFLHSSRPPIIHGNLKPSNILLDSNFVSKISDLGIRRLIPRDGNQACVTTVLHKTDSAYMPQEFLETGEVTTHCDIYAFGIILLQLLTKRTVDKLLNDAKCAMEADNFEALLDFSAGDWPVKQAKELAQLALRCCEKECEHQPALVLDILSLLEPMNNLCESSRMEVESKETQKKAPSYFICPIFQEVMEDPHIAADGYTYEGDAIKGWFNSNHKTSPMTNLELEHCNLLSNSALYEAIQQWKQQP